MPSLFLRQSGATAGGRCISSFGGGKSARPFGGTGKRGGHLFAGSRFERDGESTRMMMLPSTCIPGVSEPQLARGFGNSLERVAAGDRGAIRVILHDSLADGSSSRPTRGRDRTAR